MRVVGLDHINVPTPDFHAAMEILRDALGMYAAAVPGHGWFEQAAWLHDASGTVVLHLASADQRHSGYKTAFKRAASRKRSDPSPALTCPDYNAMPERLDLQHVPFRKKGYNK